MQAMLHLSQPVSDADLIRVSEENSGWRFERDASGALVVSPPTTSDGSSKNAVLSAQIYRFAMEFGGKAFDSSGGFTLPDTSVRSPDGAWISADRWSTLTPMQRDSFAPIVPDLWIELRSKTDRIVSLKEKLLAIRGFGASYVALVDPYERTLWEDGTPPRGFAIDLGAVCDA